jgi:hypothetical protein
MYLTSGGVPRTLSHFACAGFDRADVDALRAELGGAGGGRGIRERVVAANGELDRREAGGFDEGAKLSFQESTGNSAGP